MWWYIIGQEKRKRLAIWLKLSARVVKAFRQGQKTDANDALAIGIAENQRLSRVDY